MIKKNKIIIVLVLIVCISLVSSSFAFVIRKATSDNILTFGSIKMKLIETEIVNNTEKIIDNNHAINITTNSNITRNFYAENIGKNPMYVRISFDVVGIPTNYINFVQNDNNWIYKDGWYYYKTSVMPNKKTNKLVIGLNFDIDKITKDLDIKNIDLDVIAQAVQSQNNSNNVLDAVGWSSN